MPLLLIAGLIPGVALAQFNRSINVATGVRMSFLTALEKLITFAAASIVTIATVLFLVGAAFMVGSAGKPELLEKGKKLMKGAIIGMAITLGSYTILRTAIFFLYVQPGYIS